MGHSGDSETGKSCMAVGYISLHAALAQLSSRFSAMVLRERAAMGYGFVEEQL